MQDNYLEKTLSTHYWRFILCIENVERRIWPCLDVLENQHAHIPKKESRMHKALNEVDLQNLFNDGVIFHEESNDGN